GRSRPPTPSVARLADEARRAGRGDVRVLFLSDIHGNIDALGAVETAALRGPAPSSRSGCSTTSSTTAALPEIGELGTAARARTINRARDHAGAWTTVRALRWRRMRSGRSFLLR